MSGGFVVWKTGFEKGDWGSVPQLRLSRVQGDFASGPGSHPVDFCVAVSDYPVFESASGAVGNGASGSSVGAGSRASTLFDGSHRAYSQLAELYLAGGISFGAAVAGLCSGAGLGLVVLFRMDNSRRECAGILALLYAVAVLAGLVLQLWPI